MATFMNQQNRLILKILALYLLTSIAFLSIFLFIVYHLQKKIIFDEEAQRLNNAMGAIFFVLRHKEFHEIQKISDDFNVRIGIIQANGKILFSNLSHTHKTTNLVAKNGLYIIDGHVYLVDIARRAKAKNTFVILEGNNISDKFFSLKVQYIILEIFTTILVGIIAFFLIKILLKPLKQHIEWLNRFLKDSTHEINTPLSVIIMSIERFSKQELSQKNLKRLNNINIAAKTLTHIYDDLVYLNFPDSIPNKESKVDLLPLIEERLDFFGLHITQKQLVVQKDMQDYSFYANPYKISKLIDNLLSNAIKYNKMGGFVHVSLKDRVLCIENSGEHITQDDAEKIFTRYVRVNKDQGGFGIGLSLVADICKEYKIGIQLKSDNESIKFFLQFP